jgi:hypothetical protein
MAGFDPDADRVEDVPEPGLPAAPAAEGPEASLARIVGEVRTLFVALTALMVAVNTVIVAVSNFRTGQQVQAVQVATDENRAQIREVGKKADAVHKEVKQLDAVRSRFATPPADAGADEPGPGP